MPTATTHWINDKKQHLYIIRSSVSSTVNCKEKLKHVQKSWNTSNFSGIFLKLVHTGTPLPAKAENWEDLGNEGREKATAERAQESEKVPHVPTPEEYLHRTFTHTHTAPLTASSPPRNQHRGTKPDCQHSKCQSHPWWEHPMRTGCHYWWAQRWCTLADSSPGEQDNKQTIHVHYT